MSIVYVDILLLVSNVGPFRNNIESYVVELKISYRGIPVRSRFRFLIKISIFYKNWIVSRISNFHQKLLFWLKFPVFTNIFLNSDTQLNEDVNLQKMLGIQMLSKFFHPQLHVMLQAQKIIVT